MIVENQDQYNSIQDQLNKAQEAYDNWLSGVNGNTSYNKSATTSKNRGVSGNSAGRATHYTTKATYNASKDNTGKYVLDKNGNYVENKNSYYQGLINSLNDKLSGVSPFAYSNDEAKNLEFGNLSNQQTLADQALKGEATSNQATAIADKRSDISAGIDKNKAGLLGKAQANDTTNGEAVNNYVQNQSNQSNTQADWLKAQGALTQAYNKADLQYNAVPYAMVSGGLQGASTGATLGATVS